MLELVLATANCGKVEELRELLRVAGLMNVVVRSLADFPDLHVVEETGVTFAENALMKARTAWQGTGLPALADDSGLEIDVLQGAPGVWSARFAGKRDDEANIDKVLLLMEGVPAARRGARFQCALALAGGVGARDLGLGVRGSGSEVRGADQQAENRDNRDNRDNRETRENRGQRSTDCEPRLEVGEFLVVGSVEGQIATERKGDRGFGYDPVFYLPERDLTMAQLSPQEKNAISHRARAFERMLPILRSYSERVSIEHS